MIKPPVVLALALALAATPALTGCDRTARLTEQEHIQRAKDFEDKGDVRGSIIELKNAIQKNPNSAQARLLLGQAYLRVAMGAEAEKEFRRAIELGVNAEAVKPQLGEALLHTGEYLKVLEEIHVSDQTSTSNRARIQQLRADALLRTGKLQEACELFAQSLATDKENPPTYWGLSQCAVAQRDLAKAREWLDAALQLSSGRAKTWVLIGNWEQLNKNTSAALKAYEQALEAEPHHLDALQSRATLNIALGRTQDAWKDIERYRNLAPRSVQAHYLQAFYLFDQNKYAEAQDVLQNAFKTAPDHLPSILLAGATAYALEAYQQAETYLQRFLARFPRHAQARKLMAATQIRLGNADRALEMLAPLLTPETNDIQTLTLASDAYRVRNEPLKASALLQRAASIDPENAAVKTQLGITYLSSGDTGLAINEFTSAASQEGDQTVATELLAQTYLASKQYDKVLSVTEALLKKNPENATAYNLRARAQLGQKDNTGARASYEQALRIDPVNFTAAGDLAGLDLQAGKPDAARKRFEAILKKDETHLEAMLALARLALAQNQEQAAVGWLEKATRLHPKAIAPHTALVRHHLQKRAPQKALAVATSAVNEAPDSPEALTLLATAQLATGDKGGAIATFNKLVQKSPQSPEAHLQLAQAYIADKQLKGARASLQKALQLRSDHVPSQETLIRLEVTEGRPDAALAVARQMQSQQPGSWRGHDREGDLMLAENRIQDAIKAYQTALDKGAGGPGLIKWFRAQVLDNRPLAEERLNAWLRRHPQDHAVRAYAAEYAMRNGRNKEAIAHYEAINRAVPNKILLLNNLASLYLLEKDPRARPTAELAAKLAPDNPNVLDTLGWILVQQGQVQRGLEWLGKAKAKAPRSDAIRYHHAAALARAGNRAEARKALQQLLNDSPEFDDADAARALLKTL
jgi:putative PEP-CTERM system TPR-repeat lipoprotein